nr:hypothetical protein GCM10010200_043510 [Actinomadura rugatobispora]
MARLEGERLVRRQITGTRAADTVPLWLGESVLSGVLIGPTGFLAVLWSAAGGVPRRPTVPARSGRPDGEWQAVGNWFVVLGLLGLDGLVLFLGVEMPGWMLGV